MNKVMAVLVVCAVVMPAGVVRAQEDATKAVEQAAVQATAQVEEQAAKAQDAAAACKPCEKGSDVSMMNRMSDWAHSVGKSKEERTALMEKRKAERAVRKEERKANREAKRAEKEAKKAAKEAGASVENAADDAQKGMKGLMKKMKLKK